MELASRTLSSSCLISHERRPRFTCGAGRMDTIILDLDATDDPLHGEQEGRFFHAYYDCYCYLPLYVFSGRHLLVAKLRSAAIDAAAGAIEEVARVVAHIRRRWPRVRVLLRADSGFAREDLMAGARPTASTSCSDWPRMSGSSPRSRPNSMWSPPRADVPAGWNAASRASCGRRAGPGASGAGSFASRHEIVATRYRLFEAVSTDSLSNFHPLISLSSDLRRDLTLWLSTGLPISAVDLLGPTIREFLKFLGKSHHGIGMELLDLCMIRSLDLFWSSPLLYAEDLPPWSFVSCRSSVRPPALLKAIFMLLLGLPTFPYSPAPPRFKQQRRRGDEDESGYGGRF